MQEKDESGSVWQRVRRLFGKGEAAEEAPVAAPVKEEMTAAQRRQWQRGMPVALLPFFEAMLANLDTLNYIGMRVALHEEYATRSQQALDLFGWYGHGAGSWEEYPPYETVAEQFLMELPLAELVAALTDYPLEAHHLEGAARFFAGDLFQGMRGGQTAVIPADVRQALIEHMAERGDTAKLARVQATLG